MRPSLPAAWANAAYRAPGSWKSTKTRTIKVNGFTVKEGDWISLNGSTGEVYLGQVATMAADLSGDFGQLMDLAGKYAVLKVRANADTPKDAAQAFGFGAEGIGLCRTEHM